jgi:hypothetical protein
MLSSQIFFYFQGQNFILCNFLCLSVRKVMGQGNCYISYKCCFILPADRHCWSLPFSVITVLSQYKIMLDDSSTGSELYLKRDSISIEQSMAVPWWVIFCQLVVSPQIQKVMSTWLLYFQLFHPLNHSFCTCQSLPLLSSASHNF